MEVMFFYFGNTQKVDFISSLVTFWGAWAQGRREHNSRGRSRRLLKTHGRRLLQHLTPLLPKRAA